MKRMARSFKRRRSAETLPAFAPGGFFYVLPESLDTVRTVSVFHGPRSAPPPPLGHADLIMSNRARAAGDR